MTSACCFMQYCFHGLSMLNYELLNLNNKIAYYIRGKRYKKEREIYKNVGLVGVAFAKSRRRLARLSLKEPAKVQRFFKAHFVGDLLDRQIGMQ